MVARLPFLVALTCLTACGAVAGTSQLGDAPAASADPAAIKHTAVLPALAYSPYHGTNAACPTADAIHADFARMHAIANSVRIYALRDCAQGEAAMAAAADFGMRVNLGLWLAPLPGDANGVQPVTAELQALGQLLDGHDPNSVSLITVGNETQATQTVSSAEVVSTIGQVRSMLAERHLTIPVTTAQIVTDYTPDLIAASDLLLPNIHPYWAGVQEPNASTWVIQTAKNLATDSNKEVVLGETGWPTAGDVVQNAVPSQANSLAFMQAFVCDAAAANLDYTYFEGFDVNPSSGQPSVEAHWGVMDGSGSLKATPPSRDNCPETP